MMKDKLFFVVITLVGVCVIGSLITVYILETQASMDRRKSFEQFLEAMNLNLQKGDIQSPAVIVDVDKQGFLNKIQELDITIVYYEGSNVGLGRYYYVFTEDYTIAYRYTSK